MRHFLSLVMVMCLNLVVDAEMRTWTLVDGRSFEAQLSDQVSFSGDIKLVDAQGKELSIPTDRLSAEDLKYIDIIRVPELDIDFIKSFNQILFSSKVSQEVRPPEIRAKFGVRVKQKGSGAYEHELTVEFFALGRQIYADRYMLLHREKVSFTLSKENNRNFEYMSDRILPIKEFNLYDWRQTPIGQRGEKYHGYLVLVTDELGNLVAHEESSNWLFNNVENMKKLKIGNYFDKHGERQPPIRPATMGARPD